MLKLLINTIGLRSISSISTLAFTFLATKFYGLSGVGDFAFFLSIVTFFSLINGFGVIIPFFIIFDERKDSEKKNYYNYLLNFQSLISIIISFIAFTFLFFFKVDNNILIILTSFFIPKILINAYTLRSFGSINKFIFFQQGNIHLFGLLYLFLLNYLQINNAIILSYFLGTITHFLFSKYFIFQNFFNYKSIKLSFAIKRNIFIKSSFNFLIIDLISYCANWIPVFIILFLLNSEALGAYYNIIKIGSVFLILLFIIESIIMKDLRSMISNFSNKKLLKIKKIKKDIIYIALIIFLTFIFFGNEILIFIDSNLKNYTIALLIYSLARMLNLFFGPQSLFMKLSENQKTMQAILLLSTSLNVFLSFLLVPALGVYGIFYAILSANLLWCFFVRYFIKKNYNFTL
tara:strand:- start:1231 stop:2442 length:1212 start_codon:yes stop_codon:yes gene_type:complete